MILLQNSISIDKINVLWYYVALYILRKINILQKMSCDNIIS